MLPGNAQLTEHAFRWGCAGRPLSDEITEATNVSLMQMSCVQPQECLTEGEKREKKLAGGLMECKS